MKKQLIALLLAVAMVLSVLSLGLAEQNGEDVVSDDPFEQIKAEFKNAVTVEPYVVEVHPTRVTGWAEMLWAPTEWAPIMATYAALQPLTVLKETPHWLLVKNEETGDIGYIEKELVSAPGQQEEREAQQMTIVENGKANLGVIDINGAFLLQSAIPDGYTIDLIHSDHDLMLASLSSDNPDKPVLHLAVAFDEHYANVERMNDLDDEALAELEKTYTDNDSAVNITYGETGLGTRLMIAAHNDGELDYVDFLSIYKGYFVELAMTPGQDSASRTLTEEQVSACIAFLTELDFVPAETTGMMKELAGQPQTANLLAYDREGMTVEVEILHQEDAEGDNPTWRPIAELKLSVGENTVFQDDIDPATGEKRETPAEYSGEEFLTLMFDEGLTDFAADNMLVTFDEAGNLIRAERFTSF